MFLFFITVISIVSINADFVGLKESYCQIIEENFEDVQYGLGDSLRYVYFGENNFLACSFDTFKTLKATLSEQRAKELSLITGNSELLKFYGMKEFDLYNFFEHIYSREEEGLQTLRTFTDEGVEIIFYLYQNRVFVISADWTSLFSD